MAICKLPGCDNSSRHDRYCSPECGFVGRQQNREREHDRAVFEAARNAPTAQPCSRCPGGFYATDEAEMTRCGCGRDYEVAA